MEGRTPYWDTKRKAVFEVLEQFPDSPTRQTARIIYNKYPEYFRDYEECRAYVRRYRGQSGGYHRDTIKEKRFFKPIQKV